MRSLKSSVRLSDSSGFATVGLIALLLSILTGFAIVGLKGSRIQVELAAQAKSYAGLKLAAQVAMDDAIATIDAGSADYRWGGCSADFNADGFVNASDQTVLLAAWGTANAQTDLSGDGVTDGVDLGHLLAQWGDCRFEELVPGVVQESACTGDFNSDRNVDGVDLAVLLAAWGTSNPQTDLNGNGTTNGDDLGIFLAAWGPCESALQKRFRVKAFDPGSFYIEKTLTVGTDIFTTYAAACIENCDALAGVKTWSVSILTVNALGSTLRHNMVVVSQAEETGPLPSSVKVLQLASLKD